jgi:hypothetical protein
LRKEPQSQQHGEETFQLSRIAGAGEWPKLCERHLRLFKQNRRTPQRHCNVSSRFWAISSEHCSSSGQLMIVNHFIENSNAMFHRWMIQLISEHKSTVTHEKV